MLRFIVTALGMVAFITGFIAIIVIVVGMAVSIFIVVSDVTTGERKKKERGSLLQVKHDSLTNKQ